MRNIIVKFVKECFFIGNGEYRTIEDFEKESAQWK
jgi:hypothetical protein